MAKALKLETVAEGVETREQFEMLRAEGATLAQGFLFARPMPASDFVEYTQGGSAKRAVAE